MRAGVLPSICVVGVVQGVLQGGVAVVIQTPLSPCNWKRVCGRACTACDSCSLALKAVFRGDAIAFAGSLPAIPILDARNVIIVPFCPKVRLRFYHFIHQNLLHFAVVQVVQVPHRIFSPGNEIKEDGPSRHPRYKLVLCQSLRRRTLSRVLLETSVHKVSEDVTPGGVGQTWRLILRNVVKRAHGVHVEIGGLSLRQLNAGDPKGPNVHLAFVLTFVHGKNDFRRHPIWRSYKAVGGAGNGCRAKVCELDVADVGEEDVPGLDVSVDSCLCVQVVKPIETTWKNRRVVGWSL